MMETIYQEPQQNTLVMMVSDWSVQVRDSVREMVVGLEEHLPAEVIYIQLVFEHLLSIVFYILHA